MALNHPLKCHCGTLKGNVDSLESGNRGICYCKDCQAFARFLGRESEVLDDQGGTEVVQILPKHVHVSEGMEALACVRLTDKGILRWYASCCNTPIGSTLPNYKISYVGLVHSCLIGVGESLDESMGPVRMLVNTKSAKGEPKPKSAGVARAILRITGMLARARLDGGYRHTPFFNVDDGTPVVQPEVLSPERLEKLKNPA